LIITTNITTKNGGGKCYDVAMTMNSTMPLSNFVELTRVSKVEQFTNLIIAS
jgi:hypothetical protein